VSLPRIALLSSSAGVKSGGAESYTFGVAHSLRTLGAQVCIFHGQGGIACPCESIGVTHECGSIVSRDSRTSRLLSALRIYRATRTSPYDLEVVSRLLLSAGKWRPLTSFDVVEVQYPTEAIFFRLCSRHVLKILHLHGPAVPVWLPVLCRMMKTEPDLVITCSEWSRQELLSKRLGWPIEVNYNGVDEGLFQPAKDGTSRDLPSRPFRVGFVSRLVKNKGLDTLAEVACRLGDGFEFHVVGAREGEYDPPTADNVRYLGDLPNERVAQFLRTLDCFYFPSRRESFGIAPAEAMCTGLPVIASAVGGLPELISHCDDGILLPEGEVEGAVWWLRKLRDDTQLRRRIGALARAKVVMRFTLKHTARRLLELCERWKAEGTPLRREHAAL
jgi:glycosyltransferase involved in cell wall biosynthesis